MSIELRVPQLPESVSDATILSWHKQPGEAVQQDESLVDLETDKVVLEVPAPQAGVLKEIRFKDGDTVQAEDILGIIEAGAAAAAASDEDAGQDEVSALSPSVRRLINDRAAASTVASSSRTWRRRCTPRARPPRRRPKRPSPPRPSRPRAPPPPPPTDAPKSGCP